jgi:hypothetical protein
MRGPACLDPPSQRHRLLELAPHVAHRGHTVDDEQGEGAVEVAQVRMHVPQARDEVLAGAIDDPGRGGIPRGPLRADRSDPALLDDNGHVGFGSGARSVDDSHVADDQDILLPVAAE